MLVSLVDKHSQPNQPSHRQLGEKKCLSDINQTAKWIGHVNMTSNEGQIDVLIWLNKIDIDRLALRLSVEAGAHHEILICLPGIVTSRLQIYV